MRKLAAAKFPNKQHEGADIILFNKLGTIVAEINNFFHKFTFLPPHPFKFPTYPK